MTTKVWTETEVRALGVLTDLETGCSVWGIGRTRGYELARTGEFPSPVVKIRGTWAVPVAPLLRALGLDDTHPEDPSGSTGTRPGSAPGGEDSGPDPHASRSGPIDTLSQGSPPDGRTPPDTPSNVRSITGR